MLWLQNGSAKKMRGRLIAVTTDFCFLGNIQTKAAPTDPSVLTHTGAERRARDTGGGPEIAFERTRSQTACLSLSLIKNQIADCRGRA